MKKILNLGLIATAVLSFSAMADDPPAVVKGQLALGNLVPIVAVADIDNSSVSADILAVEKRGGFVKNNFAITVSANVGISALDDNTRFGVVAGSNRGRAVFTGTSEGGSVSQCGGLADTSKKGTEAETGATFVATALDLDAANGCKIAQPTG